MLVLDDIVQLTTRDECGYSEMLTHVPMLEHGRVKQVMIAGGGALRFEATQTIVYVGASLKPEPWPDALRARIAPYLETAE